MQRLFEVKKNPTKRNFEKNIDKQFESIVIVHDPLVTFSLSSRPFSCVFFFLPGPFWLSNRSKCKLDFSLRLKTLVEWFLQVHQNLYDSFGGCHLTGFFCKKFLFPFAASVWWTSEQASSTPLLIKYYITFPYLHSTNVTGPNAVLELQGRLKLFLHFAF